jgi:hypothetical protein
MPTDRETATFDYGVPAELFLAKRKAGTRQPLIYRRFATAAEAIRFAIEELPAVRALGAWMQVGDLDCYHFATQSDGTRWNGLRGARN